MALEYVSIPTQIVFKSCKLVAVMVGSSFILGKTYSIWEYLIAGALVSGMCLFAGGDLTGGFATMTTSDYRTWMGLLILVGALVCDSLLGNIQEKVQKTSVITETELMFVQSSFGLVALAIWTVASGEMAAGIKLCFENREVFFSVMAWSVSQMIGTVLLLKIVGDYSAVAAVLTSFVRKVVSLLFSYFFFPKPLTANHFAGFLLVFGAMASHSWYKQSTKSKSVPEKEIKRHDSEFEMDQSSERDVATTTDSNGEEQSMLRGEQRA
eukprot:CAMPEP_0184327666 /NCGR_PEP_ID=MMETSP1049-20130417/143212_1 /TAXON_ID=77928 /ORGANISM="Proteomonas sulcata, Strain CCMP704" /LENGTH=266 /DNA_ID=CAMNT_0026649931 /DNA_START=475 /DNA_END=1275 /DNA_ORIENTATION=-